MSSLKYRPEIDGLRTVAVIAVIIYHAEFGFGESFFLTGGFFGVDVFFVISGFLITSLIINEHQRSGRFYIANFYERRARRILPALLTVMIASLPFAWIYLLPDQLVDFAKSQLASLFFGSNIYWLRSLQEYGAESALLKPFLHTWSLAIEEQFYIFFPLIFWGLFRWKKEKYIIPVLSIFFVASLLFAEWMTPRDISFSFYMLPSRFWEMLAGGLLANIIRIYPQRDRNTWLNQILPITGLAAIILVSILVDLNSDNINHPGFITFIPVLGTVLVIWFSNGKDIASRILSTKTFVGIGLISYSLYLWHYPIFAFGRIIFPYPDFIHKLVWIFLTFVLSVLSFYMVETPFRKREMISVRKFAVLTGVLFLAVGGASLVWWQNNGYEERLGYLNNVLQPAKRVWVIKDGIRCQSGGKGRDPFPLEESCIFDYSAGKKYIISIGDSHADSLSENLRILSRENDISFIQISQNACPHILEHSGGRSEDVCLERSEQLLEYLSNFPDVTIVYSIRTPWYVEQSYFDNQEGDQESDYQYVDPKKVMDDYPVISDKISRTLNGWLDEGYSLVLVYPVPEQGFKVSRKLFSIRPLPQRAEELSDLSTSYDVFTQRTEKSYQIFDNIVGEKLYRVYPENFFCEEETGRCYASKGSEIFFYNDNHVSPLGSSFIVAEIGNQLGLNIPDWGY
jgi:peptidoglycan/LPS O-acetylase OafA/YrhL